MFGLNKYAFANATGDTPQREWNVYVDPEAAAIVYNSGVNLVAIGLDVATHFDVNLTENDIAALDKSDKMEAGFLRQAIRFVNGRGFEAYCTVIDCMAVAYSIDESLIETFEGRVGIETKDGLTLGNTVVDYRHHHVWEDLPKVKIARNADHQRFLNMLMELVLAEDQGGIRCFRKSGSQKAGRQHFRRSEGDHVRYYRCDRRSGSLPRFRTGQRNYL